MNNRWKQAFIALCGGIPIGLGVLAISGWWSHNAILIQVHPTFVPMQFNTALGVLLSGAALLVLHRGHPTWSTTLGFTIFVLGFFTYIQYSLNVDFRIDELFFQDYIRFKTSHPGRMSQGSAVWFMLVGIFYLLTNRTRTASSLYVLQAFLIFLALSFGFLGLLGHVVGYESAYSFGRYSRMAVHTCISFSLLGFGCMYWFFQKNSFIFESPSRRVPIYMGMIPLIFFVIAPVYLEHREEYHIKESNRSFGSLLEASIRSSIMSNVSTLEYLVNQSSTDHFTTNGFWNTDFQALLLLAEDGTIKRAVRNPRSVRSFGTEHLIGQILKSPSPQHNAVHSPRLVEHLDFTSDSQFFGITIPLLSQKKEMGSLLAIVDLTAIISDFQSKLHFKTHDFQLSHQTTAFFSSANRSFPSTIWAYEGGIQILGDTWTYIVWPTNQYLSNFETLFPEFSLLGAILFSLIISLTAYPSQDPKKIAGLETLVKERTLELTNANKMLNFAQNETTNGWWNFDLANSKYFVSPAFWKTLGRSTVPEHSILHELRECTHPDDIKLATLHFDRYLVTKSAEPFHHEMRYRHIRGHWVTMILRARILEWGPDGRALRIVGTHMDITSLKDAEQRTLRYSKELESANEELERFTFVASHDLQEPLRIISAYCGMLPKDLNVDLPKAAQDDIYFITDAARRMQQLIEDLLSLSQVRKEKLHFSQVQLSDCVNDALRALALRIKETNAECTVSDLPTIEGDRRVITQLFQNLIGNALKFCPDRSPIIHVDAFFNGTREVIRVRDNGIGIEHEFGDQIFSVFQRLHHSSEYEGTGIGLSICKRAVKLHGGAIWAESDGKDKGTTFYFTLREMDREVA